MNALKYLEKIDEMLVRMQLVKDSRDEEEINALLLDVFDEFVISNYEDSRATRIKLFEINDKHPEHIFAGLLLLIDIQLALIRQMPIEHVEEQAKFNANLDDVSSFLLDLTKRTLETIPRGTSFRISDIKVLSSPIPDNIRNDLLSFIISVVQRDRSSFQLSQQDIQEIILTLAIGRQVAHVLNKTYIFYALCGVVINMLNTSQLSQLSRDFAEEILFTSYIDGMPEWGYQSLFQAFNGHGNVNLALIYANACAASIRHKQQVPDLLFKRMLITFQRLLRDIRFADVADQVYRYMISNLTLTSNELFDITHTRLSTRLREADPSVVDLSSSEKVL